MADESDGSAAGAQGIERVERLIECLLIEAAEALVDEEATELSAARLGLAALRLTRTSMRVAFVSSGSVAAL
ncbi:hypothetical protein [Micromonospora sp. NPDC049374]|uniref:hypothetical protein n=1 Tax=Micromonospora sp. NPDC049374 TaxID=3154352 RepID=UPI00343E6E1E